jgi:hypothetical protein
VQPCPGSPKRSTLKSASIKKLEKLVKDFFSLHCYEKNVLSYKPLTHLTEPTGIKLHNHLENNWNLSNKKALF